MLPHTASPSPRLGVRNPLSKLQTGFQTKLWRNLHSYVSTIGINKKLSYCWETVRRESMPRIAEMDVEKQPRLNDLQMYFKVIKSGTNRKLVYDFLLVVYSNFCRITHRF